MGRLGESPRFAGRRRHWQLGASIVAAAAAGGLWMGHHGSTPPPPQWLVHGASGGATPQDAVTRYYTALSFHDWSDAARYVDGSWWRVESTSNDGYRENLVSLDRLRVGSHGQDPFSGLPAPAGYTRQVELSVEFHVQWHRVVTSYSGGQVRFDVVGESSRDHRWYVLSEGTGP